MNFRDKLLIAGCVVAIAALMNMIAAAYNPHGYWQFWGEVHDIAGWLLALVVLLGTLFVLIRLKHMWSVQTLKEGTKAVVLHGKDGPRVERLDVGLEPLQLLSALKQSMQANNTAASMIQRWSKIAEEPGIVEEKTTTPELPAPSPIPANVRYEDVRAHVPKGHAILGVDGAGVKTCEFGKILTCLILGGSGTGKSNTIAIKAEEAVRDGWKIIVIDPHKRKEDSLFNRIKEFSAHFLRFDWLPDGVAQDDEQVKQVFQWFLAEFKRRMDNGRSPNDPDILIICDEVGNLADSDDEEIVKALKKIARICGNESRGFGMAGWFINQNATGIAWLRKVVMTVIVHKINMMSERKVACNENEALARHMDEWPKHGRVYVYGLSFEGVFELQMPKKEQIIAVDEMPPLPRKSPDFYQAQTEKLTEQTANLPLPSHFQSTNQSNAEEAGEAAQEAGGSREKDTGAITDLSVVKSLREIGKRLQKGETTTEIVKSFGLPYGRATQELKATVEFVEQQLKQAGEL